MLYDCYYHDNYLTDLRQSWNQTLCPSLALSLLFYIVRLGNVYKLQF